MTGSSLLMMLIMTEKTTGKNDNNLHVKKSHTWCLKCQISVSSCTPKITVLIQTHKRTVKKTDATIIQYVVLIKNSLIIPANNDAFGHIRELFLTNTTYYIIVRQ